jgi:phosphomannomutase
MEKISIECFKAYDVRGRVPDELNEEIAYRVGRAFVQLLNAKRVALGHDIRLSSPCLAQALARGITEQGADVVFIGQCGTEEIYFSAFNQDLDGAVMVTASHNPKDYNGMKFVAGGARPISGESGLNEIRRIAESGVFEPPKRQGTLISRECNQEYIAHLLGYIAIDNLSPLKVLVNAGNGGAGAIIDILEAHLPFEFIKLHHEIDGTFPNGVPNPLLVSNRQSTSEAIRAHGADLGIAWDGDFDRCFFFDENGSFIQGYYIVSLLAEIQLKRYPGGKVIYDPRLTWGSIECIEQAGGAAVQCKTGHAFIKDRMRKEDAVYGGEMSAHHYFRDFAYCDSGMIPWLLVAEFLSNQKQLFSKLVAAKQKRYPCSDEINHTVSDPVALLKHIEQTYTEPSISLDQTDGLGFEFSCWRFNVRLSNTEPVIRLNIETRGDQSLLKIKIAELQSLIERFEAPPSI